MKYVNMNKNNANITFATLLVQNFRSLYRHFMGITNETKNMLSFFS